MLLLSGATALQPTHLEVIGSIAAAAAVVVPAVSTATAIAAKAAPEVGRQLAVSAVVNGLDPSSSNDA